MKFIFWTATVLFGWFVCFKMFPGNFETAAGNGPFTDVALSDDSPTINPATRGGKLFLENCATCHNRKLDKDLTGPALFGILDRVDREKLIPWIQNSGKVLESGDPYFRKLWQKWNKASMTAMPHLSKEDVDAIIDELSEISG